MRIRPAIYRLARWLSDRPNWILYFFTTLPALVVLPLLDAPVPLRYHSAREVAGYFQSLAFIRSGLSSYLFITPQESYSSLHLHSLLSAPLVGAGYVEGGRLVSLIAVISAVIVSIKLTQELFDTTLSSNISPFIAGALVWVQPPFQRFSYIYQPESLSIALTGFAILAAIKSRNDEHLWFPLCVILLILAIWNHAWEATVALPIVVVFIIRREWRKSIAIATATVFSLGVAFFISNLQSDVGQQGLMSIYGIQKSPTILISTDWWIPFLPTLNPHYVYLSLLIPFSVASVVCCLYKYRTQSNDIYLLIGSWLVSALSILVLLPFGWIIHGGYYAWGFILPLAILGAVAIDQAIAAIDADISTEELVTLTLFILIFSSMIYGVVFEVGIVGFDSYTQPASYSPSEKNAVHAGQQLRAIGVKDPNNIIFVGSWPSKRNQDIYSGETYQTETGTSLIGRIYIYSGVLPRDGPTVSVEPHSAANNKISDKKWCVYKSDTDIDVKMCSEIHVRNESRKNLGS